LPATAAAAAAGSVAALRLPPVLVDICPSNGRESTDAVCCERMLIGRAHMLRVADIDR